MPVIEIRGLVREIFSYVVRIYRRDGEVLAGLVEQVKTGRTAPFATLAELSDLLSGRRSFSRPAFRRAVDPPRPSESAKTSITTHGETT
jgi:hypothetical protein